MKHLIPQVLDLSEQQRRQLAVLILESLQDRSSPGIPDEQMQLLETRLQRQQAGQAQLHSEEELWDKLERYRNERKT